MDVQNVGGAYYEPIPVVPPWQQHGASVAWNAFAWGPAVFGVQLESLVTQDMMLRPRDVLAWSVPNQLSYLRKMPGAPYVAQGWMQQQSQNAVQQIAQQNSLRSVQTSYLQQAAQSYYGGLPNA